LRRERASRITTDKNKKISLSPNLTERVQHQYSVDYDGTIAVYSFSNNTLG
jgi:hypothetical protein